LYPCDDSIQQLKAMTRDQVYIETLEKLVRQAAPWVVTRMNKHHRQSKTEKQPYYRERQAADADTCEQWQLIAADLGLDPTSTDEEVKP